ncbi:MAG: M23 family metallopeptidase [Elusimicrobia bacterium]|nr:M23 family metallopeptidase [Elusimicrobiota bacterium]
MPLGGALLFLSVLASAQPRPADSLRSWARFSVLTPAGPEAPKPEVLRQVNRLLWATHKVVKGEYSAAQIARLYGTTLMSLQSTNRDELYLLPRYLTVLNKEGLLYEVRKDTETLDGIVARFKIGQTERRQLKEWVVKANGLPGYALIDDYELEKGERLLLPGIKINFDTYHYPVTSVQRLSSRFGLRRHPISHERRKHVGIDIPKPYGTPVYPARSGIVVEAGWREGYGMLVIIRHPDGFSTRYGHLSKITVKDGQLVQRGKTLIGKVGSTGNSTGPHLHWEVRDRHGNPVNPSQKIGRR